jgi:hypothetical protein
MVIPLLSTAFSKFKDRYILHPLWSICTSNVFLIWTARKKRTTVDLYGEIYHSTFIDTLLHSPQCLTNLGPLWIYLTCFSFETANGDITKYLLGTQHIDTQIFSTVNVTQMLPHNDCWNSTRLQTYCATTPIKRIRVRISPQHPLLCRKRNWMVTREDPS